MMHPMTPLPPQPAPNPIAHDGDELHFCSTCAFSGACLAMGYGKPELLELHCLVEHTPVYRAGEYVFRTGDPFRAILAVRSGMVKTSRVDRKGREQVLGFYLPGEVIGLDAIYPDRLPCDAIALEDTVFCRFSFPAISALATRLPAVQRQLFQMISKELGMASLLAGDHGVDERLAAFLVDLGDRYAARGLSATQLRLSMRRSDIANYLRLAAETVSRSLRRFRAREWLRIEGRDVTLLQPAKLREMASCVLNR